MRGSPRRRGVTREETKDHQKGILVGDSTKGRDMERTQAAGGRGTDPVVACGEEWSSRTARKSIPGIPIAE